MRALDDALDRRGLECEQIALVPSDVEIEPDDQVLLEIYAGNSIFFSKVYRAREVEGAMLFLAAALDGGLM